MSGIRAAGHALFFILAVTIVTVFWSRHPTESARSQQRTGNQACPRSTRSPRPGNRGEPLYPILPSGPQSP